MLSTSPTIYSVGQINKYIKDKIEKDPLFENVYIKGELSNFKKYASGHMYFSLKDKTGVLSGVMFSGNNKKLKFTPKDGMKVIISGNISVYERDGKYQLYALNMQPDGVGSLHLAFEQLKEKLSAEGLFDEKYKKPFPKFPKKIAVITSPSGAAVHDILTTLKRRFPIAEILFMPVVVQGEPSAPSISKAINLVNKQGESDVIIVGRGGGSIEDLWAFNEEIVARSIFNSTIPIISAVGHETDFTISDFVSDLRAPTPTAAAELATPVSVYDLKNKVLSLQETAKKELLFSFNKRFDVVSSLKKTLEFRHPSKRIHESMQVIDNLAHRLKGANERMLKIKKEQLNQARQRLIVSSPKKQIEQGKEDIKNLQQLLLLKTKTAVSSKENKLQNLLGKLDSLSPLKTMNRGYSLTFKDKEIIKSGKELQPGDEISVRVSDASLICTVNTIKEEN